jgi:hypothetical protein
MLSVRLIAVDMLVVRWHHLEVLVLRLKYVLARLQVPMGAIVVIMEHVFAMWLFLETHPLDYVIQSAIEHILVMFLLLSYLDIRAHFKDVTVMKGMILQLLGLLILMVSISQSLLPVAAKQFAVAEVLLIQMMDALATRVILDLRVQPMSVYMMVSLTL